jgi:hypothetical protein
MTTENTIDTTHYNIVDSLLVPHTMFERAHTRIAQCFKVMSKANDPMGIAVIGESRTGKSRVLEHFEHAHPPVRTEAGLRVPFLRVKVMANPTVKGLATLLLHALRDPKHDKGTEIVLTLRLQTLIKELGTVVLAIDEFQHFQDKSTHKLQHEVADWLKVLIDETRVGLIVTGLPNCMAVIRQNEQLAGRFMSPVVMRRFDWKDDGDRADFIAILVAIRDELQPFQMPDIGSELMAFRIYCATGGLIGYVIKLLKQATWNALDANTYDIPLPALATAYRDAILGEELRLLAKPNPFEIPLESLDADLLIAQAKQIGLPEEAPPKPPRSKKPPVEPKVGEILTTR